jgi:hypothetical protein
VLDSDERSSLSALLQKIAGEQGLTPGIHPGYRGLGKAEAARRSS